MSQENVKLIERVLELAQRNPEALRESLDAAVQWDVPFFLTQRGSMDPGA